MSVPTGPVFSREYSTSSEVVPHYSVSFDYGPESPVRTDRQTDTHLYVNGYIYFILQLSNEAISFNSFKEKLGN